MNVDALKSMVGWGDYYFYEYVDALVEIFRLDLSSLCYWLSVNYIIDF